MKRRQNAVMKMWIMVLCLTLLLTGSPLAVLPVYAQEEKEELEGTGEVEVAREKGESRDIPETDESAEGWQEPTQSTSGQGSGVSLRSATGIPIDENQFPDPLFRAIVEEKYDQDGDGVLSQSEIDAVTHMDLQERGLSDLTGIGHFTELTQLYCGRNQLSGLDVSGMDNLEVLYCEYNRLTQLDVSGLDNLVALYCEYNRLTQLDVSGLDNLMALYCEYNQLTELNVSGLDNLIILFCSDNRLTSLNVSGLSNLKILYCSVNRLSSLNMSGCSGLVELYCSDNQLTGLDIRECGRLETLDCHHNTMASPADVIGYSASPIVNFYFSPQRSPNITYYTVWLEGTNHGRFAEGDTVILVVDAPDSGLRFLEWQVNSGNVTLENPTSPCTTFTMPAEDVELDYVLEPLPAEHNAIWILSGGFGAASSEVNSAAPGEEIVLTPSPTRGYQLESLIGYTWTGFIEGHSDIEIHDNRFIMQDEDVVILAMFEPTAGTGSSRGSGSSGDSDRVTVKTGIPASAFSWDDGALVIDHDGLSPTALLSVQWNGKEIDAYTIHTGSMVIRFDKTFLAEQPPGTHTVRIEFWNHTGQAEITLTGTDAAGENAADGSSAAGTPNDNPSTGTGRGVWPSMLLCVLCLAAALPFGMGKRS